MNFSKWLTVIGALLLVCGLVTAFISTRYTERVVSEEQRGATVRAPESDSASVYSWADFTFYTGLVLAAVRRGTIGGFCRSQGLCRRNYARL